MTLTKTVVTGAADQTVDVTGMKYVKITHGRPTFTYVKDGTPSVLLGYHERPLPLPEGITSINVKVSAVDPWFRIEMLNFIPIGNGAELYVTKLDNGTHSVSGDHEVVLLGQSVDLELVDIKTVRPDFDGLSSLFNRALSTRSPETAAQYLKLKKQLTGL